MVCGLLAVWQVRATPSIFFWPCCYTTSRPLRRMPPSLACLIWRLVGNRIGSAARSCRSDITWLTLKVCIWIRWPGSIVDCSQAMLKGASWMLSCTLPHPKQWKLNGAQLYDQSSHDAALQSVACVLLSNFLAERLPMAIFCQAGKG